MVENVSDRIVIVISITHTWLSLSNLKAMASDGASVVTGAKSGVSARFKALKDCNTLLTINRYTRDGVQFVKDFNTTMLPLWTLFKNSLKMLKIYMKGTLGYRDLSLIPPK